MKGLIAERIAEIYSRLTAGEITDAEAVAALVGYGLNIGLAEELIYVPDDTEENDEDL